MEGGVAGWRARSKGREPHCSRFTSHHTTPHYDLTSTQFTFVNMSDDEQHNHQFESANAGASQTYPMQCSALRKNGHVVIKGRPCKIVDMSTSKTGKHGHAKVHLVAIDIFTGKKLEDISPSTHNMDVPNVSRTEYQLVNVDDGFLNLMSNDGTPKDDVRVPEGDVGKQIQDEFEAGKELIVTVCAAMGEEHALSVKEAPKGAYSKKYGAQVKTIQELFPEWNDDDVVSLLQETHGSVETAIERITQGQATQWGSVPSKKSKKPQTTAPVRGGGRGQRGRGSSRGGAGGRGGGRGHRQASSSSRPANGEQAQDSTNATWGNSTGLGWGNETSSPAWGGDSEHKEFEPEHKEPEATPVTEALKTNGTPMNGTSYTPTKVATPAQSVKPPAPTKAPQPTVPATRSWASLLKPKATPPPVAKQPSPAPQSKPQPPPQTKTQAPPPPAPVAPVVEPEPLPEPEPEPELEPEPFQEEEPLEPEPVQEPPAPESEPEPVEQLKEEAPESEPTPEPEIVPEPKVEPVVAAPPPPPPGLNLVTQQAPLPDPAPQAPHVSLPASVSLPAPSQSAWRAPSKVPSSRSIGRYPKTDQAVVLPSGYEDKLTGSFGGLSFGQFGEEEESKENEPTQQAPSPAPAASAPVHAPPPSVTLPIEPPSSQIRKDEPAPPPPHLTISDQLPQAQAQIQQQQLHQQQLQQQQLQQQQLQQQQLQQQAQISQQSALAQPQPQPQSQQDRIPTQHQAPLASHIQAQPQPAPQPAPQQQAPPAQPQAPQEQPQQHVPLHTYEPFPQHAHGHSLGNAGVNLYQQQQQHQHQHQHQQSSHTSPFAQPQPQQPQQQTGLYGQQSYGQAFGQRTSAGLGAYPGHVQEENAGYGAFGASSGGIGGFERYGYDQGGHSHQAAGFYDSYNHGAGGFPPRSGTGDDLAKSSPGQQPQNVIPNPSAAQSQPQQPQPQQPQQQPQQQPPNQQQQQSGGYAPMPYFYAPYYQNQYFGQPSPNYGQPFMKYPPMYPQQSQQSQPQSQQSKTQGSLYAGQPEEQYGQQQQPQGYDYSKSQGQVQGGLQSLLGGQAIREKARVGAVGQTQTGAGAGYYGAGAAGGVAGAGAGAGAGVRYPGYQQQAPEQGYYSSYPARTPQQPNQTYGQWQ